MGRDAVLMDGDAPAIHREAFLAGGLTVRALFRSILNHPRYRAATEAPSGFATKKLVTAGLMASQIEGITGFKWTQGGTDMMTSDAVGVGPGRPSGRLSNGPRQSVSQCHHAPSFPRAWQRLPQPTS